MASYRDEERPLRQVIRLLDASVYDGLEIAWNGNLPPEFFMPEPLDLQLQIAMRIEQPDLLSYPATRNRRYLRVNSVTNRQVEEGGTVYAWEGLIGKVMRKRK